MRSLFCTSLAVLLGTTCFASGTGKKQIDMRVPVKLQIRHADPWAVKALIEGTSLPSPEISTIIGVKGNANGNGNNQQSGNSPLLKDGYLVVNPTDNSLWWYPKKQ